MKYENIEPELLHIDYIWYCSPQVFIDSYRTNKLIGKRVGVGKGKFIDALVIGKWSFLNPEDGEPDEALLCIVSGVGLAMIPFITLAELRADTIENKSIKDNVAG